MPTFLMPLRLASVVVKRRSRLLSIVNRPKTQQSLLPFDTETKFLGYLNRWYATGNSREKPLFCTNQSCRAHIKVLHVLFVYYQPIPSPEYDTSLPEQCCRTHIPIAPRRGAQYYKKKGWDQLYLEPIRKEGFLETARAAQEVTMQERHKQQDKLKFKEQTAWMTEHGNIDDFVASWERQEHVPLMPLTPEVFHVTDTEKIWHER